MGDLFSDALLLPAVALAVVAFLVPRWLARRLPEGVWPLVLNAFLSAVLMVLISGAVFFGMYVRQGFLAVQLAIPDFWTNVIFFGRLGVMSGIIWVPIVVLSVASLPKNWVKETW